MYPFRYPFDGSYRATQGFGENPDVYAQFDLDGHNGIDFGTPLGTEIKAVADGVVRYVGYDSEGYGHYIRIDHHIDDCHFQTLYCHGNEKPFFEEGNIVKEGEIILSSGDTGFSTGPHLHFGLRGIDQYGDTLNYENGYSGYIDPQPWLDVYENNSMAIPDWAEDAVNWAVENNILDSLESAQQPVSQEAFKYTLAVMLYRYYLEINDGEKFTGESVEGQWPDWAVEAVNWCLLKEILDSSESVLLPVSQEAFKYTLAIMLYRYYLEIDDGENYTGEIIEGQWPDWASEAVSWSIAEEILDSAESVMQKVSQEA